MSVFILVCPSDELLAEVRESGTLIFSSATTAAEAIWLEEQGVDAIIAQGVEAGGHRGIFLTDDLSSQLPTKQLLKEIVERVKVPVIAAGGVGSAQDVKDLIELGASAVQVGTSFLLCDEAKTSPLHREALAASTSPNTVITNIFSGRPARGIVNGMVEKLGAWNRQAPSFLMQLQHLPFAFSCRSVELCRLHAPMVWDQYSGLQSNFCRVTN